MTLVNARAAFEKAVTDAVATADNTVQMVYDNVHFTTPGKNTKYILMSVEFTQATLQNQGASSDYYAGVIQCNIYCPKGKGTATLSAIGEAVTSGNIDGLSVAGGISGSGNITGSDIYSSGRIYEQGSSVIDHATAMAIVFGG